MSRLSGLLYLDKKLAALTTIGLSRYAPIMGRAYDLVARAQRARQKDYMDANLHSLLQSLDCTKKVNFLDVGAGASADPIVSKYPDHFQTILVEPRKDEAERLRQKGEALIIDKALGSSEGIEVLHHTSAAELSSILEPDSRFARIYGSDGMEIRGLSQIETTSIEAAMSELDIASLDYLKVDTQGTELAVLAGLGEYRPLIVAAEVFFIPAYKKSCLI